MDQTPYAAEFDTPSFFEGTEKKMEMVIDAALPSLRERGRAVWDRVCRTAGATILSVLDGERCTAFLLSESSLFVFDHKLVMITCGRTQLTRAVTAILQELPAEAVRFFVYERKNEVFPHAQPTSFHDDVRRLHERLPGRAFLFGQQHAQHLLLFHLDRPYRSETPDRTVELLMYDLAPEVRACFVADGTDTGERRGVRDAVTRLLPGHRVDTHQFEPTGYSVNAVDGESYWTVHVTPEAHGSYASFETNHRFQDDLEAVVGEILALFRPRAFDLVQFQQQAASPCEVEGYRMRTHVAEALTCGYDVHYRSYFRPSTGVLRPRELPVT